MNKMIWKSLLCFALCAFALTFVSCGDDDDNNTENLTPSQQTASIVGNWVVTNTGVEPHIIFFKADGTGGFMEYSTSSGTYHQDGEFRWVQNVDGSYSFSGAGLHDGIQAMAVTSLNGDNMSLWLQWPGEEREYYTLKRTTADPNSTPGNPSVVNGNIVGNWVMTNTDEPHFIFVTADGAGGFMEYSTSGNNYHQDGAFKWTKNADGTYSFSGAGLHHGIYAMGIVSLSGDNMRAWIQWKGNKEKEYGDLKRLTNSASVLGSKGIVGKWNIKNSNDYFFFNADGMGGYMEYGSTGYHQDGAFRWMTNPIGSYSFTGDNINDGVYRMYIENVYADNDQMDIVVMWEDYNDIHRYSLERVVE